MSVHESDLAAVERRVDLLVDRLVAELPAHTVEHVVLGHGAVEVQHDRGCRRSDRHALVTLAFHTRALFIDTVMAGRRSWAPQGPVTGRHVRLGRVRCGPRRYRRGAGLRAPRRTPWRQALKFAMADDPVAQLYGLPLNDFVPGRDALARELRREGDKERAAEVAKLEAGVAAWAVNQLARRNRKELDLLLDAGHRLRTGQEEALKGGDRGKFEAARSEHDRAITSARPANSWAASAAPPRTR